MHASATGSPSGVVAGAHGPMYGMIPYPLRELKRPRGLSTSLRANEQPCCVARPPPHSPPALSSRGRAWPLLAPSRLFSPADTFPARVDPGPRDRPRPGLRVTGGGPPVIHPAHLDDIPPPTTGPASGTPDLYHAIGTHAAFFLPDSPSPAARPRQPSHRHAPLRRRDRYLFVSNPVSVLALTAEGRSKGRRAQPTDSVEAFPRSSRVHIAHRHSGSGGCQQRASGPTLTWNAQLSPENRTSCGCCRSSGDRRSSVPLPTRASNPRSGKRLQPIRGRGDDGCEHYALSLPNR